MFRRKTFLVVIFLFSFSFSWVAFCEAPALEYSKTFGGVDDDRCFDLVQTSDNGFLLVGNTRSFGADEINVYIVKVDSSGLEKWDLTWGNTPADNAFSVQETFDGGYIVCGTTQAAPLRNEAAFLLKLNTAGDIEWNQTYYDSDYYQGWDAIQTSDGGFLITGLKWYGTFTSHPDDDPNVFLIKTDELGNVEWNQTYGYTEDDRAFAVVETSEGGYVFAGNSRPISNQLDKAYAVKVDDVGDIIWEQSYGVEKGQFFEDLIETKDGEFVGVGVQVKDDQVGARFYIVKMNSNGNEIWNKTILGNRDSNALAVLENENSELVIVGTSGAVENRDNDVHVVKLDSSGDLIWESTYGGTGQDIGNSVAFAKDGGIVLGGETSSSGQGSDDMYFLKLESENQKVVSEIPSTPIYSVIIAVSLIIWDRKNSIN